MLRNLAEAAKTSPEAFVKTTFLNNEDAYEAHQSLPHLCAARRLVEDTGCAWPGGQRIRTVQTLSKPTDGYTKKIVTRASDHCLEFGHFLRTKNKIDVAYYVQNVSNRFVSLLRFSIPDIKDRFAHAVDLIRGVTMSPDVSWFCWTNKMQQPAEVYRKPVCNENVAELLRAVEAEASSAIDPTDRSGARAFALRSTLGQKQAWNPKPLRQGVIATPTDAELARAAKRKKDAVKAAAGLIAAQPRATAKNLPPEEQRKRKKKKGVETPQIAAFFSKAA